MDAHDPSAAMSVIYMTSGERNEHIRYCRDRNSWLRGVQNSMAACSPSDIAIVTTNITLFERTADILQDEVHRTPNGSLPPCKRTWIDEFQ
jgi:hypothetical protein